MKKNIIKIISISIISISLLISSINVNANIDKPMETLKKYNSQETISLRGSEIKIPKDYSYKEEQFRGVWVSSVFNLDFPDKKNMTEKEYKAGYIKILDQLESLNMNTIIFQIRSKSDALYKSNINPWSEYLTGTQGKSPNWDPMAWMVAETHKRGMEFHAWFNPYRVTTGSEKLESFSNNNWAKKNPEKTFEFANKIYLNPGEPDVINHINDTVMEVVENYEIDAVHFDDYFYPTLRGKYISEAISEVEKKTFDQYGKDFKDIASWRRNNIDKMISKVSNSIKQYNLKNKKDIEFGISPFGIWGHKANHPSNSIEGEGSDTPISSTESYNNQFADTRKWVKEEWIDYIAPQVYWTFDNAAAPYGEIVQWWTDVVKDTKVNLYIGHASYKNVENTSKDISWTNPYEILNQLKFNSLYEEIDGSIFFRYKYFLEIPNNTAANLEFVKLLKSDYFNKKVETPKAPSIPSSTVDLDVTLNDKTILNNETAPDRQLFRPILVKVLEFINKQ